VFLILLQVDSKQWRSTAEVSEWPSNAVVALIEWLPHLTKTTMPVILRLALSSMTSKRPLDLTSTALKSADETDLEHLVQWSDMIIFDYLTGNYDRVASMQVNKSESARSTAVL
jgi:four-jointed box protein 1